MEDQIEQSKLEKDMLNEEGLSYLPLERTYECDQRRQIEGRLSFRLSVDEGDAERDTNQAEKNQGQIRLG